MPTQTINYQLKKPLVNDPTDQEVWGYYLNDDLDVIDSELKNNADAAALAQSKAEQASTEANTAINAANDALSAAQASVQPSQFTGTNQSLASPGYQKFPGGLIIQWGSGRTAPGGGSVTFPVAFTTACLNVQVTNWVGTPNPPANWLALVSKSTTGAVVINRSNDSDTVFLYLAIGY